jgi:GNAT superfamily N-acetyltransferase
MQIHAATEADIPAIVAMSARFYETTSYAVFAAFDPRAAESLARNMIDGGVMLIAEDDSGPVGMVGLMVVPFMFNPAHRVAYEVVWWVNPDAQGLGAGKALLQAIEPACRAKGCTAIQMVHLASSPPQAAALYERLGFAHTESSYTKELV